MTNVGCQNDLLYYILLSLQILIYYYLIGPTANKILGTKPRVEMSNILVCLQSLSNN